MDTNLIRRAPGAELSPRSRRGLVMLTINIALSAVLLTLLLKRTHLADYGPILAGLPPVIIGLVIVIVALQMTVISGCRLKLILALMGSTVDATHAARVTWCGFFVEQIGAVFVTGDIARILLLRRANVALKAAIEAPLLDRAIGFGTIFVMASAGLPYLWRELPDDQRHLIRLALLIAVGGALLLLGAGLLFAAWLPQVAATRKTLAALLRSIAAGLARPHRLLAAVLLLAFGTHALSILAMYLLLGAVGAHLSLFACFLFTPTVFAISVLPASISGWGLREGALVIALSGLGLPTERVVTASVLFGLCVLAASLPGSAVWLSIPRQDETAS